MEFEQQGVTPESPAGTDPGAASSAGTLNTAPPAPAEHTVPYSRFHEVNSGYRAAEARAAALEAELNQLRPQMQQFREQQGRLYQALQQRRDQGYQLNPAQQEAMKALEPIAEAMGLTRATKVLGPLAQHALKTAERTEALEKQFSEFQQQQQQARLLQQARADETRLIEMAQAGGVRFGSRQDFDRFCRLVMGEIYSTPGAHEAWKQGDPRVLEYAFQQAKQQHDHYARASGVATTKAQLQQRVPLRQGGGQPGAAPIPTFDPKNPRGSLTKIHEAAEAYIAANGA